eukprot:g22129.t1
MKKAADFPLCKESGRGSCPCRAGHVYALEISRDQADTRILNEKAARGINSVGQARKGGKSMSAYYLPLGEQPLVQRRWNPLRVLAGAVFLASAALLSYAKAAVLSFTSGSVWTPYSPIRHEDMDRVLIKPAPTGGLLTVLPTPDIGPFCIFTYEPMDGAFKQDETSQEAWLYGAITIAHSPPGLVAVPTGKPSDIIKGRLSCFASITFPDKLKLADSIYKVNGNSEVKRQLVGVVLIDGTISQAYLYYKDINRHAAQAAAAAKEEKVGCGGDA